MKKLLKSVALLLALVIGLAAAGLLVLTIAEYRPASVEAVSPAGTASAALRAGDTVRLVSWNMGYAALGDNADWCRPRTPGACGRTLTICKAIWPRKGRT